MKIHTQNYKENVKLFGRELDSKIIYTLNNEDIELGAEQLNSITPSFQSSILKSVMKQLDIDSNVEIPDGTILNYQFGIKVNDEYEYLDFGNYVVYSVEKQEDTESYKITCYDKMLYSMINYEKLDITYPITIRDYIKAICDKLDLIFKNKDDIFANYNRIIQSELYDGLGYTFRDVLDELAQVTASTICINDNDELEIRYINNTNDTIDEEYLKDVNVKFGQKYGPINSIVLSRASESDNVYLKDEQSIEENGLCEIKIKDNQIMNFNDRSDYLPDILQKLNGLEYYLNDFPSTGITYYDLCDKYSVKIGDNTYSCIMFNDEINVTQGLEEIIHTDLPEESETDYTKADKTDIKINQTYLIVDKQNQTITSLVRSVDDQNEKISQVTQTVDELNMKISDVADITVSKESNLATLEMNKINHSEPIEIKIHPIVENISYLYPHENIFPNDELFLKDRILRFVNTETNEVIDYELPDDLLIYDSNTYDEFHLNYSDKICQVIKRCGYKVDGSVYKLENEVIRNFEYPEILLTDGNYVISLLGYERAYIYVKLMEQNGYTTQFATKIELNSKITQTANEINLEVSKKVDENEVVSTINQSAEQITITGNRFVVNSTNFKLTANGTVTCKNANITGIFSNYDSNGNLAIQISGTQLKLYDYEGTGAISGVLASTRGTSDGIVGVNLHTVKGNRIALGYTENESDTTIKSIISFDTNDLTSTPWIKNTVSGTLFSSNPNGGITIEHGLIKNWNMAGMTGSLTINNVMLTICNGLIIEAQL